MKNSTFSAQVANNLLTVLQGYSKTIRLLLVMFLTLSVSANAWAQTKTDIMFAKGFGSYTTDSFSAAGTDKTAVANSTNATSVKYAMQVFNGSTGAVRGNQSSAASNFSCRNTTTYDGYYISQVSLTVSGGTINGSTNNRSVVYFGSTAYSNPNTTTPGGTATKASPASSGQATLTWTNTNEDVSYFILYNLKTSDTALSANATNSLKVVWTKKTAATPSYTVTATSNNNNYGTVSVSGTTITATPNAGYRVKSGDAGYTVTSGTAVVTNNGNNTFSVTPSSNCTITINFEAIPTYTINWHTAVGTVEDEVLEEGATITKFATEPTKDGYEFMGWTEDCEVASDGAGFTAITNFGTATEDKDYYAVFAVATTTSGGGSSQYEKVTSNLADWAGDYLIAYNNTTFADGRIGGTGTNAMGASEVKVDLSSSISNNTIPASVGDQYNVTLEAVSGGYVLKTKDGKYNYQSSNSNGLTATTNISTATTYAITVTFTSENDIKLALSGSAKGAVFRYNTSGYFRFYKNGGQNAVYLYKKVAGGSTTTYSGYITTCAAGDPCDTLQAPNVTATATAYSITLSWDAVDGATSYNVHNYTTDEAEEVNVLTYTFNGLDPETEYEWGIESAKDECFKETRGTTTTLAEAPINYTVTLNPNYPTGKTGVFKDKEGNIINGNLEVLLPSGTASQALTNFYSSIELDNYAFDGFYTQAEGGSKRVNTGDITGNITFYAHWKEKYTITWSVNGNTALIEPTTFAAGDNTWEMPTTDYDCSGKGFVGWTTNPIIAAQDEAPDPLYTNASQFPNATATYHAVFAEGGSGGSGGYEKRTEALDDYSGEYLIVYEEGPVAFNGGLTTLDATSNNISVTITDGVIASNATTDAAKFTFAKVDGGYSILSASGRYIGRTADSNGLDESTSIAYTNTITITEGNVDVVGSGNAHLRYNKDAGQTRFRYYKSSSYTSQQALALYKKSGSSATYTAYTTSCIASWSITYDFAGGTGSHCSNTSVPQGDTYTICDEAPTKEGNTFLHWSDGVNTYNPSDVIATVTTDITLTAVWQPKTYTVTWSVNGATTEVTYEHGQALSEKQPADPTSAACDGEKEFVGWTANDEFTYHATTPPTDLFKTTTATVTADKTYYAVFATPGAGGTEFVLGESGTFKMYANVNGTNYYAQGGVSSSQITSTTNALSASDYTLTYADEVYTIKQGKSDIGHGSGTSLSSTSSTWTISEGTNGSWRITSDKDNSRALFYSAEANAFKAYATSNLTAGNETYFDIEFGSGSNAYSDYTTICQTVESIEIANYTTEFFVTDEFAFGGTVTAHFDGGGTQNVTARAHFSGYNMNVTGTYTVTVTYMGATATYEITVKPLDNAWVLTWNVSGKTNTGLGPRSVTKGSAIGTLPTPEIPDACAGKTFMGWTESNIVPSDGKGIVYITEATVPSKNTTYYAVFATINNFSTQAAIEDIEDGSKVVIVAVASMDASGGAGQAISSRTISITSQGVIGLSGDEVSIFDETINTPHSTCIWTLTKEGGGIVFEQGGKYIRAVNNGYRRLLLETTKDYWTLSLVEGKDKTYHMQSGNTSHYVEWFDHTDSKYDEGERYIGFVPYTEANDNGDFDMQFYVTANADGEADITDYTTGCAEYTITYYGFHGGYSTSCSSDGTIVLPVNSLHTVPNCGDVVTDHTNLGREFLNVWMTQPHGGHTFKPGDTFILTQDTTLYAQWKMETTSDVTTLPTDIEDLAGTDIYVYGGTTLNIQPGTTTINSLTLKGGLQADGSYKMPTVWVPEGATLERNKSKINLDLIVNAKTWYPFAVPFATKNNQYVEYLDPVLAAASTYGTHFAIKTYDGARRADVGEDKANNWVRVLRDSTLQPGVGYIITALTYPDKDTATIRIPMTVPNTWFQNGEQAEVGTTVRNTIAVTAHAGAAATEHQRHAGWNFVANPYLTSFAGGNVANDGGLAYINGELIIEGSYEYTDEEVPYVTVPAYDFAYYSQHKLSDVKLSPEWSFFVQVGTGGTMNFTTAGRQQAPASIAARNAEERPVKMDVDLILSDNHSSDQTGIIICDRYTDAYEIGRDLEKLFGSAYNLSVYTLMEDNTPLAFQALAIRSSMQVIPVGYRAPEQGEYTFRLNEATSSIDLLNEQYEQLVLVDYQTGELTNLLYTDYTFYSERTQSNSRFAIYAVPRQNAPTDLPNAIGSDEEVRKVIYNDHLYILRDGNVYNGMGQKM